MNQLRKWWLWAPFRWKQRWQGLKRRVRRQPPREEWVLEVVRRTVDRGDAVGVLAAMDRFGRSEQFLMNVGDEKTPILKAAWERAQGGFVVEVGAYCGYSAVLWGLLARERGGRVLSVEQSERFTEIARAMVDHAGLSDIVEIRTGEIGTLNPALSSPIDLIFLDHAKERYLPDLRVLEASGAIVEGTVIVADNTGIGGSAVANYLDHVRTPGAYESEEFSGVMEYSQIPDAVEVSIRKVHSESQV